MGDQAFGADHLAKEMTTWVSVLFLQLVLGAIAGWLAGRIVKGYSFGLLGSIVVGAFISRLILPRIGFPGGGRLIGAILQFMLGAVILLVLIRLRLFCTNGLTVRVPFSPDRVIPWLE